MKPWALRIVVCMSVALPGVCQSSTRILGHDKLLPSKSIPVTPLSFCIEPLISLCTHEYVIKYCIWQCACCCIANQKLLDAGIISWSTHDLLDYGIEACWIAAFQGIDCVPRSLVQKGVIDTAYARVFSCAQALHLAYPEPIENSWCLRMAAWCATRAAVYFSLTALSDSIFDRMLLFLGMASRFPECQQNEDTDKSCKEAPDGCKIVVIPDIIDAAEAQRSKEHSL